MSLDRQRLIDELFIELADLPAADRAGVLAARCGDDAALRAEVESLLAHHDGAGDFLAPSELRDAGLLDDGGSLPPQSKIDDYTVLGVLGSGGMGVVYLAEQERPRRTVALKLIRRLAATPAMLRRFELEAQVLARLQHPGVAQVYAAGAADTGFGPQPYIAMELVNGPTLSAFAAASGIGVADRLRLVIRICEAVQHAHQRGIIHRDLKPGNILVDQSVSPPQPKILDFGVARAVDAELDVTSLHTSAGQLVGTLAYMSPEQVAADSGDIDTRSDVYALGVLMFELLTGELPIRTRGRSLPEAARMIRDEPPAKLSSLNKLLRGDLEVIVSKALEKDRERRYQSAAELAADIQRHLEGRPIAAKQDSAIYVLRLQMRRYKHFVAAGVLALLAVVTFAVFAFVQAANESRANAQAQDALAEANAQRRRADETSDRLRAQLSASNVEQGRLHGLAGQVGVADDLVWHEHLLHPKSDHTFWALWELYSRAPRLATVQAHDAEAPSIALSDAAGLVASGDIKGRIRLWDARALAPRGELVPATTPGPGAPAVVIWGLSFDRAGATLYAAESTGDVVAWDVATMKELHRLKSAHLSARAAVASPDDRRLLTAGTDGYIREWDTRTWEKVREVRARRPLVNAVYDGAGTSFAAGADDGGVHLWKAGRDRLVELRGHAEATTGLCFAPDGRRLASGSSDRSIRVWDTDTGAQLQELTAPNGYIRNVLFSRDGERLFSSGWWTIDTWDVRAGTRIRVWPVQIRTDMMVLSRDDQRLYSAQADGTVQCWETRAEPAAVTLPGHWGRTTASMTRDGRVVATGDFAGTLRLWSGVDGRPLAQIEGHQGRVRNVLMEADGQWLATGSDDFILKLWDLRRGAQMAEAYRFEGGTSCRAMVHDARRSLLIWCSSDRTIVFSRLPTLEPVLRLPAARAQMLSLRLSPDGSKLISINRNDEVKIWDMESALAGKYTSTEPPPLLPVRSGPQLQPWTSAFSPDGKQLLIGDWNKQLQIWDFVNRRSLGELKGHTALVYDVAYKPDDPGKIVTCSADGTIKLWSLPERRCLLTIDPFGGWDAITTEFAADGRTLMSASANGAVKIWKLDHFDRHIAGNLEYAIGRFAGQAGNRADLDGLRRWARGVLERPAAPAAETGTETIDAWGAATLRRARSFQP